MLIGGQRAQPQRVTDRNRRDDLALCRLGHRKHQRAVFDRGLPCGHLRILGPQHDSDVEGLLSVRPLERIALWTELGRDGRVRRQVERIERGLEGKGTNRLRCHDRPAAYLDYGNLQPGIADIHDYDTDGLQYPTRREDRIQLHHLAIDRRGVYDRPSGLACLQPSENRAGRAVGSEIAQLNQREIRRRGHHKRLCSQCDERWHRWHRAHPAQGVDVQRYPLWRSVAECELERFRVPSLEQVEEESLIDTAHLGRGQVHLERDDARGRAGAGQQGIGNALWCEEQLLDFAGKQDHVGLQTAPLQPPADDQQPTEVLICSELDNRAQRERTAIPLQGGIPIQDPNPSRRQRLRLAQLLLGVGRHLLHRCLPRECLDGSRCIEQCLDRCGVRHDPVHRDRRINRLQQVRKAATRVDLLEVDRPVLAVVDRAHQEASTVCKRLVCDQRALGVKEHPVLVDERRIGGEDLGPDKQPAVRQGLDGPIHVRPDLGVVGYTQPQRTQFDDGVLRSHD